MQSLIKGVNITELKQICDERGAVLHMLRSDAPEFTQFGECYFSEILPGVVKAWKKHQNQTQNLAVPIGKILMVIYDDRDESETYGAVQEIELGRPDNYLRVLIPPGLWYGFSCIGETSALISNCADLIHDPSESNLIDSNDPKIPFCW